MNKVQVCIGVIWMDRIVEHIPSWMFFLMQIIQLDDERGEFVAKSYFDHPYPTTKIMWAPEPLANSGKDLLATTGDFLRIWCLTEDFETRQEAVLYNVRLLFVALANALLFQCF